MKLSININLIFNCLLTILLSSCHNKYSPQLEQALNLAGDNRDELEKVLEYYSKDPGDSLKFKAACFLVENMPYQSFVRTSIEDQYKKLDSIYFHSKNQHKLSEEHIAIIKQIEEMENVRLETIFDLQYLSATYLIHNIDNAFKSWNSPWAKHLDFNEFCEYLLPYRAMNEPPTDWRTDYKEILYPFIKDKAYIENYNRETLIQIIDTINKTYIKILLDSLIYDGYKPSLLINRRLPACEDFAVLGSQVYRALGIPVSIDFTPQWANRSLSHTWNAFHTEKGKTLDYSFDFPIESFGHQLVYQNNENSGIASKVYRYTYSRQPESLALTCGKESIPPFFMHPCIKDVTHLYIDCMDIEIPLKEQTQQQFAYLANFDNQEWIPVQWGKIKKNNAYFSKMGKGIVYLPMLYKNSKIKVAGDPFILNKYGELTTLTPDTTNLQTVFLERKYPERDMIKFAKPLIGAKFQVATKSDFSDSVTVHEIKYIPEIRYNKIRLDLSKSYRYFRFIISPELKRGLDIAEIEIYSSGSDEKLTGELFGNRSIKWTFDGDPLSMSYIDPGPYFIGIDFGSPKKISHFRFLPRNDDNFIKNEEEYELFYWKDKWVSLGIKYGNNEQELKYSNVPSNALLLLKNNTKGKEERIFTYENGKQTWW